MFSLPGMSFPLFSHIIIIIINTIIVIIINVIIIIVVVATVFMDLLYIRYCRSPLHVLTKFYLNTS